LNKSELLSGKRNEILVFGRIGRCRKRIREARKDVEKILNEEFSSRHYGEQLEEMTVIAIIRCSDVDPSGYPEEVRYNRKHRQFEARLKIDTTNSAKPHQRAAGSLFLI
jgi:hypothetical protein